MIPPDSVVLRKVVIAGSTGSIGTQAIEVAQANPTRFEVVALGAHKSVQLLARQAHAVRPRVVAIGDETKAAELAQLLPKGIELLAGNNALAAVAAMGDAGDVTVNAVVGFAGLEVTLRTLRSGKRLALANKESLVAAGPLVKQALDTRGAELLPVDSEHGALFQCLLAETGSGRGAGNRVARLVITASGGPFRRHSLEQLNSVRVDDALNHPTWKMGPKITIDSSTLFNKGLEVIEAHELFDIPYSRIEVVVHPQSIVHSAVEFTDGSTIAQLSKPDMRLPIGYAMGYPDRLTTPFGSQIDWTQLSRLDFEAPDLKKFRCLHLAYEAGRQGGVAPAVLNAANEVAVEAFLAHKVTWREIASIIEETLSSVTLGRADCTESVIYADSAAPRRRAHELIGKGITADERD